MPNKAASHERRDRAPIASETHWRGVGEPRRSAKSSNANGVPARSPGLPRSGYPGFAVMKSPSTPTGLRRFEGYAVGGTPLGFDGNGDDATQGSPASAGQPWAGGRNAFSVPGGRCHLPFPRLNQARQSMPVGSPDCSRTLLARHACA